MQLWTGADAWLTFISQFINSVPWMYFVVCDVSTTSTIAWVLRLILWYVRREP